MKRLVTQKEKKNVEAYPDELHYFPMTLKFYSAWFYRRTIDSPKTKVLAEKEKGQKVVCSLMLDEMSIRKHAQYDGIKVLGYVDLGAGITDNWPPVTTKALDVYMAVSVNSNWKIPCSYF